MPKFEAEGQLVKIYDTQVISDRFQKREFILRVEDGQYPQELNLQFTQSDCGLLDSFSEGDQVSVSSWVRGRKWQRSEADAPKWFNSLVAFSIKAPSSSNTPPPPEYGDEPPLPTDDDNLPF